MTIADDAIEALRLKQGIPNSIDPEYHADTLQIVYDFIVDALGISISSIAAGYHWSTDTDATDPGVNTLKVNNADTSLATELYVSASASGGYDYSSLMSEFVGDDLYLLNQFGVANNNMIYRITARATDNGGWFTIPVEYVDGAGGIGDDLVVTSSVAYTGERVKLETQGLYYSAVDQIPLVDNDAEIVKFELVHPLRDPSGISYDIPSGEFTFNVDGEAGGSVTVAVGRAGGGATINHYLWGEYFNDSTLFVGGDDTWHPYGFSLEGGVSSGEPATVSTEFFVEECIYGQKFRFMHAVEDSTKSVGLYSTTLPVMTGVDNQPLIVASAQFNIRYVNK